MNIDFQDIIEFIKTHKIKFLIAGAVLLFILIIKGGVDDYKRKQSQQPQTEWKPIEREEPKETMPSNLKYLMDNQENLILKYGQHPDGFIYEYDGSLVPLGDPNLSPEDVVYAFIQGLTSLDMATAQKYSYKSNVVSTYSKFFETYGVYNYTNQFNRDMYGLALSSIQLSGENSIVNFAENKQVITVKAKIIDFTDKDFWKEDAQEIFEYIFNSGLERDSTKYTIYLYNYILAYYKSSKVPYRDVTFDITVEKLAKYQTNWIVTQDEDIDSACSYKDGANLVQYIKDQYYDYGFDPLNKNLIEEKERQKESENLKKEQEEEQKKKAEENFKTSDLDKITNSDPSTAPLNDSSTTTDTVQDPTVSSIGQVTTNNSTSNQSITPIQNNTNTDKNNTPQNNINNKNSTEGANKPMTIIGGESTEQNNNNESGGSLKIEVEDSF
jgi:hypothetical protein